MGREEKDRVGRKAGRKTGKEMKNQTTAEREKEKTGRPVWRLREINPNRHIFDLLDSWLENTLTMGSDMPRNEMTIKKSAVESIINCKTFEPLKDDVHFQNIIKRLKTLEENG